LLVSQKIRNKVAIAFPPAHVLRGRKNIKKLETSLPYGDNAISQRIKSGKPTLIGRLGGTEARVLGCYLDVFKAKSLWDPLSTIYSFITFPRRINQLRNLSGVYPSNVSTVRKFVLEQLDAIPEIDILGCWGQTFTWAESISQKSKVATYVSHHSVAPWVEIFESSSRDSEPWSLALEGKKVLVISGFSETFKKQHMRIGHVFEKANYPNFSATFIKAPISLGGVLDNKSWVDHLVKMKNDMESADFDIALISAGAYALPLANHAKKLGKIGISCGGELQLFFGVMGKRWEKMERVTKYQNEFWVRPSQDERPRNWRKIENGCYW